MLPKTIISFGRAERWVGKAPRPDALLTAFLSSLQGSAAVSMALYKAAARHFLYWIEQQGLAISAIDDAVVQRFEKHRCRCQGFSCHEPNRPTFSSRVRRFVRFLEDRGVVGIPDDVDNLDTYLVDYAVFLVQQHYSAASIRSYRSEAAHFAAWVRVSRLRWADLTGEHVAEYASHDCRCPVHRKRGTLVGYCGPARRSRGARRFLGFLRDRNILPQAGCREQDHPLRAYEAWLKSHCGTTDETIWRYCGEIKRCLPMLGEPSELDAAAIRRIVIHRITQAPGSASLIATIVRSYVRFLTSRGERQPALLHALPPIGRYRLGSLPRYLDEPTIERIIASCKADTAVEIRDKAIILLLAGWDCELAMSAGFGWPISIPGASPLQIVEYRIPGVLRERQAVLPSTAAHQKISFAPIEEEWLFLGVRAPFRPFSSSAQISGIVARVFDRGAITGVPTSSHTFRHSLATRMLRAGAGLDSVGTILRHRSPATTAIYAKVDVPMLLKVAQNWPGDVAC